MAWVNRTSRDHGPGTFYSNTAAVHLGPGQYETDSHRRVRPNAAPFGTGAVVERSALASKPALVTPGPGAYGDSNQETWESPVKAQAAVSSFKSKTERSSEVKYSKSHGKTPGPGAYATPDSFTPAKKKASTTYNLSLEKPRGTKVKWTRLPSAPSIPSLSQSFGYENVAQGKLVRHQPVNLGHTGVGDDTPCPGEYDPLKGLKSVNKSRAADFSKSKVTRVFEQETKAKADVPGPGQYANQDPAASTTKEAKRSSAVFKSTSTREKGGQLDTANRVVPGPGSYYDGIPKSFNVEKKPENLQFFGSTSTRFEQSMRDALAPGPGTYYSPPPSVTRPWSGGSKNTLGKKKRAPFSSKSERFNVAQPRDVYLAAPGSYNLPTAMSEVLGKVSSRVHTFGSTTKRLDSLSAPGERTIDTPETRLEQEMNAIRDSHHQPPRQPRKSTSKNKMTSVFASSSERFHAPAATTGPSPGDYEIQPKWNAAGAQGIFKSGSDRLGNQSKDNQTIPGPGAYSPDHVEHKPQHLTRPDVFFGGEARFKKALPKMEVPGPGYYNSVTVDADWNRPTYNITIATEMELAMMN